MGGQIVSADGTALRVSNTTSSLRYCSTFLFTAGTGYEVFLSPGIFEGKEFDGLGLDDGDKYSFLVDGRRSLFLCCLSNR